MKNKPEWDYPLPGDSSPGDGLFYGAWGFILIALVAVISVLYGL